MKRMMRKMGRSLSRDRFGKSRDRSGYLYYLSLINKVIIGDKRLSVPCEECLAICVTSLDKDCISKSIVLG